MNVQPFNATAKCFAISVTATASSSTSLSAIGNVVRLCNNGVNTCYVSIGTGSQVATVPTGTALATCTPVLPGTDISLSIPNSSLQNISAIADSGKTTTLLVQVGEGL